MLWWAVHPTPHTAHTHPSSRCSRGASHCPLLTHHTHTPSLQCPVPHTHTTPTSLRPPWPPTAIVQAGMGWEQEQSKLLGRQGAEETVTAVRTTPHTLPQFHMGPLPTIKAFQMEGMWGGKGMMREGTCCNLHPPAVSCTHTPT